MTWLAGEAEQQCTFDTAWCIIGVPQTQTSGDLAVECQWEPGPTCKLLELNLSDLCSSDLHNELSLVNSCDPRARGSKRLLSHSSYEDLCRLETFNSLLSLFFSCVISERKSING